MNQHIQSLDFPDRDFHEKAQKALSKKKLKLCHICNQMVDPKSSEGGHDGHWFGNLCKIK